MNEESDTKETLIDDILNIGNFINANEKELNEIKFLLDLSIEECHCKSFT